MFNTPQKNTFHGTGTTNTGPNSNQTSGPKKSRPVNLNIEHQNAYNSRGNGPASAYNSVKETLN